MEKMMYAMATYVMTEGALKMKHVAIVFQIALMAKMRMIVQVNLKYFNFCHYY
jgi:hypothetical protein